MARNRFLKIPPARFPFKTSNGLSSGIFWVYEFDNCFLGSPNQPETALRKTKTKANFFGLGYYTGIPVGQEKKVVEPGRGVAS